MSLRWCVRWAELFLMTLERLEWSVWAADMIPSLPFSLTNNNLRFKQNSFSVAPSVVSFRRKMGGGGGVCYWIILQILEKLWETSKVRVRWDGHMSGVRSAEITGQRHESNSVLWWERESVCFVLQPNKEGQVVQPSFCSTSVFLVWEEVWKKQEAVLRCGASHLKSLRDCWSVAYMVTHALGPYFRSSTDTTWLFVSCRKVFPSFKLSTERLEDIKADGEQPPLLASFFFSDIYEGRSLSGFKPDTVIQETTL